MTVDDARHGPTESNRHAPTDQGVTVNDETTAAGTRSPLISRRNVLRAGVLGAAGVGIAGVAGTRAVRAVADAGWQPTYRREVHLAATDGWVSMPKLAKKVPGYWPDTLAPEPFNMYVFGFRDLTGASDAVVIGERGKAQISAPVLSFDQGSEVRVTLTNLGLSQRPDLVDGHTMHWHGFNNAIPIFDGVPEMSASVPIGKSITYLYRPHDAGTYMYHCHFEDVEHVQMGMTGLLFVRPLMNYDASGAQQIDQTDPVYPGRKLLRYVFNDEATRYDREFPIFLTENMPEDHFRDAHIQISDWSTYDAGFALFNGRAFPDTIADSFDPMLDYEVGSDGARLKYQPQTARIDVEVHEKVLLRVAHLGSVRHTITVDGIPLHVVGADATPLRGEDGIPAVAATGTSPAVAAVPGTDNTYFTNSIDIGPGESRDVIFDAPAVGTYLVYDRNFMNMSNTGGSGYGGMLTHLVVHPAGTLGPQTAV